MNVAVVGSGPSGVFAAHALAARGFAVTVLDVGETLDARRSAIVSRFRNLPPEEWPDDEHALIRQNATVGRDALPKKMHFGSDYIYAGDRPFAPLAMLAEGRVPFPTFAKGGFSNIWGAAVLPPDACDMADWPVSRGEMEPFFRAVAELLPLCGGEGTLSLFFPPYKEVLGELDPGPQGRALLADLERAGPRLAAADTLYGKARLAIHTAAEPGILPCSGCGHCFTGCVRDSIFSTVPMLAKLERQKGVNYRAGVFVDGVDEAEGGVTVDAVDVQSGERHRLSYAAVFLAAGPINSTRLVLRSKRLYDRPVRLKESQKFVIPMLRARGAATAIEHPSVTFASVFLETKVRALSDHWLHVQAIPMNRMIFEGIRLPAAEWPGGYRLWSPLLRRTMTAWCGMHSDHSSHVELCLRRTPAAASDTLELDLCVSATARAAAHRAARDLFSKGLAFGTLFCHWMIRFANPGSGTHCGASLPMRGRPTETLESDSYGRVLGWKRIFVVDAAVLPSIPGTTLTFPVIANAYRIGSLAPL